MVTYLSVIYNVCGDNPCEFQSAYTRGSRRFWLYKQHELYKLCSWRRTTHSSYHRFLGNNEVNFRFSNAADGVPSSITEVYFDDGTLFGLSTVTHSAGNAWTGGSANPPELPGGDILTPVFETSTGFLAQSSPQQRGSAAWRVSGRSLLFTVRR